MKSADSLSLLTRLGLRDKTAQSFPEEALREQETMLRLSMRSSRMGVWCRDLRSETVYWSPELEELCGFVPGQFDGTLKTFRELVHPDDRENLARTIDAAISGRQEYLVEFRFRHASGEWRWMEGRGQAIYDAAGEPLRLYGLGMDITERRQSESARAYLAAIVQSSDDAIVSKTLDGHVNSWNPGAERLFGYSAEEMIGKPISVIIPPELLDEERKILARLRAGESIQHYDTVRVTRSGKRIDVSLSVSPIRDSRGVVIGASKIARDITDRKRAEAALRESEQRKDEFLAVLAHELRGPLAPIRNGMHILRRAVPHDPTSARSLAMMERQLAHMVRLIDDLMDINRITRGKLELRRRKISLAEVVDSAVESIRAHIEAHGHELTVLLKTGRLYVDGDFNRLAQVFSNLLSNSAKYTDRGGQIRLTVEREGRFAVVTVRDNGIGIPPESIDDVFQMFTQVHVHSDRTAGGLGIGLSLVRSLVQMHGGTVSAHSEGLGKGSSFVVRLPLVEADGETIAAARGGASNDGFSLGTPRQILIADDNEDSAASLAMLLELGGHEVRTVYDGAEAIKVAEDFRPSLIFMDLGMPRLNGLEAARAIRAQDWGSQVRIVAVTGWGQEADRRRTREAGIDHHLVKPVDLRTLSELLNTELSLR